MKTCLLVGVRASSRFAIGEDAAAVSAASREALFVDGKAVIVCDVEVIDDVVLPVFAILAFWAAGRRSVSRFFSR